MIIRLAGGQEWVFSKCPLASLSWHLNAVVVCACTAPENPELASYFET